MKEMELEAQTYYNEARRLKLILDQTRLMQQGQGASSAAPSPRRKGDPHTEILHLRRENSYLKQQLSQAHTHQTSTHILQQLSQRMNGLSSELIACENWLKQMNEKKLQSQSQQQPQQPQHTSKLNGHGMNGHNRPMTAPLKSNLRSSSSGTQPLQSQQQHHTQSSNMKPKPPTSHVLHKPSHETSSHSHSRQQSDDNMNATISTSPDTTTTSIAPDTLTDSTTDTTTDTTTTTSTTDDDDLSSLQPYVDSDPYAADFADSHTSSTQHHTDTTSDTKHADTGETINDTQDFSLPDEDFAYDTEEFS